MSNCHFSEINLSVTSLPPFPDKTKPRVNILLNSNEIAKSQYGLIESLAKMFTSVSNLRFIALPLYSREEVSSLRKVKMTSFFTLIHRNRQKSIWFDRKSG